ncbi:MAG: tetratricopeptide repeat protein [Nitrososphaera sp.]|nr:tetratricopeptide repeat protein [Nitrososphaera sp.]
MHQRSQAIVEFDRATKLDASLAEASYNLGVCFREQKSNRDAFACLSRAVELESTFCEAQIALGQMLFHCGKHSDAERCFRLATQNGPASADALCSLAHIIAERGNHEEAVQLARRAIRIAKRPVRELYVLGYLLEGCGRFAAAEGVFQRALQVDSEDAQVWARLTSLSAMKGDRKGASKLLRKALRRFPKYPILHLTKGLLLLSRGHFPRAWQEYEWRLLDERRLADPLIPRWNGSSLRCRALLVLGEQGLGEQILFARLVAEIARKARHVYFVVDQRLVKLLDRSLPKVRVIGAESYADVTRSCDCHIEAGSLGQYCRQNLASFDDRGKYLFSDAHLTEGFRQKYMERANGRRIIGVSWASKNDRLGMVKTPPFHFWEPIFRMEEFLFVNLQYGVHRNDIETLGGSAARNFITDSEVDPMKDLYSFASQVDAVDLVITVSNTCFHVAGALARPTYVLMPTFSGTVGSIARRNVSLWYKMATVFTAKEWGDPWSDLFSKILEYLRDSINKSEAHA